MATNRGGDDWYRPKEHWWDISDSESEIPQKEQMPPPPRNLTTVDKKKYDLEKFVEAGQLKEHMKEEAYQNYYRVKF